ncbi:MAG TPA: anthranilate synthase component I family protein [Candidatus Limnocylindria bacterium]|nr:anthranilate synthase component I family protein [Candidatus Limnocylindria bacterium]
MAVASAPTTLTPLVRQRIADLETPVSAFAKLRGMGGAFLLESVEGGERVGRYSFIGVAPFATFTYQRGEAVVVDRGAASAERTDRPFDALRAFVARYRRMRRDGLPPFSGGAVGYVSYDAARRLEPSLPAHRRDVSGLPELRFGLYDTVVAFDHLRRTLAVIAHDVAGRPGGAEKAVASVFERLAGNVSLPRAPAAPRTVAANMTPDEFARRAAAARELIRGGDCIQIVLSQRFDVTPAPEPLALYRALRHVNPSPYLFFLDAGEATLVGASPEPFVQVRAGRVVMHPIAGTRPRGGDDAADAALEAELRGSEKERAEHVMLVDLARNDIGRIAAPGTVTVRELMRVDRFSHVMHLTSVVEGQLGDGRDALDAFAAAFPAGTVSGAPKLRAMQRIAELEDDARGPYAGAVGYVDFDGALDTCLAIRTAVVTKDVCRIQAGAGIVADSEPAAEEAETRAKAGALLRAIELVPTLDDAMRGGGA